MDPTVLLNLMVELAGLEEELVQARALVDHHRRRDRHLRELQEEYEADAAAAAAAGLNAAVSLRQTDARIREVEAALERKRRLAGGAADSRQRQALVHEIKSLEEELDRLETVGLALVDEVRQKDGDAGQALQEREAQDLRGAEELQRMQQETARAKAAEAEIVQEIERLVGLLPDNVGRHVGRLRSQYSQAVVRVQSGACGGCFSQLPVQQGLDAAKGRALVRCASCARYIVRQDWK